MGFKHTGLFPEQAVIGPMSSLIRGAGRKVRVLNLFAYTGGATVACAKAGAEVTMWTPPRAWSSAREKTPASPASAGHPLHHRRLRQVRPREIRRGNRYDAIVMDPPSYGGGRAARCGRSRRPLPLRAAVRQLLSDSRSFS